MLARWEPTRARQGARQDQMPRHRARKNQMPTSPDPDNQMLGRPVSQMLVARSCLLVRGPSEAGGTQDVGFSGTHTPTCCGVRRRLARPEGFEPPTC